MKNSAKVFILFLLFSFNSFSQDASTYFPSAPGFTWNYKVVRLDSANNEISNLTYYRIDSFAVVQNYAGMQADVIVSKVGLSPDLPFSSVLDTAFISFNGSEALTYYRLFNIDSLIGSLGSTNVLSKISNKSDVNGWISYYRFTQIENQSYQVFSLDTTVVFNNSSIPVRFEIVGTREADQNIQTDAGIFNCKKFVFDNNVSVRAIGTIYIKLFTISDTVWIASNQWIVQDLLPTTLIDLSFIGLGKQNILGSKRTLISQIPTDIDDISAKVNGFKLYQNYPNPFNPSTIIKYSLSQNSKVEITIHDILGNKVATLINNEQNAGDYSVEFNPSKIKSGISTGVYFYTLKAGTLSTTKKLIYLK
jgi:Secretion system C-terminal sorting domain